MTDITPHSKTSKLKVTLHNLREGDEIVIHSNDMETPIQPIKHGYIVQVLEIERQGNMVRYKTVNGWSRWQNKTVKVLPLANKEEHDQYIQQYRGKPDTHTFSLKGKPFTVSIS